MIRFVILFALASALGAPILAAPARADAKADLAAAIKAEESKTYDKALRLYGRALAAKDLDEEGRARAHFGRANILIHIKRRWTTAIRELDALIRLRPDYRARCACGPRPTGSAPTTRCRPRTSTARWPTSNGSAESPYS